MQQLLIAAFEGGSGISEGRGTQLQNSKSQGFTDSCESAAGPRGGRSSGGAGLPASGRELCVKYGASGGQRRAPAPRARPMSDGPASDAAGRCALHTTARASRLLLVADVGGARAGPRDELLRGHPELRPNTTSRRAHAPGGSVSTVLLPRKGPWRARLRCACVRGGGGSGAPGRRGAGAQGPPCPPSLPY